LSALFTSFHEKKIIFGSLDENLPLKDDSNHYVESLRVIKNGLRTTIMYVKDRGNKVNGGKGMTLRK